jgi:hypothetical protein
MTSKGHLFKKAVAPKARIVRVCHDSQDRPAYNSIQKKMSIIFLDLFRPGNRDGQHRGFQADAGRRMTGLRFSSAMPCGTANGSKV